MNPGFALAQSSLNQVQLEQLSLWKAAAFAGRFLTSGMSDSPVTEHA